MQNRQSLLSGEDPNPLDSRSAETWLEPDLQLQSNVKLDAVVEAEDEEKAFGTGACVRQDVAPSRHRSFLRLFELSLLACKNELFFKLSA